METLPTRPLLSVVVIGRNEGLRLVRCLESIQAMDSPGGPTETIYVDSASTDGSAELARQMEARVIPICPTRPTAALGRNAGWRASTGRFILFLDGDTILHPKFVVESLRDFQNDTAVVFGNRREIHPEVSTYNRVLDLDWMSPAGLADYCGGDALMRRECLEAVDGYDETLIAGEEPEMCRRMRALGWRVLHIDRPMTGHDLAMTRWSQYWRRAVRTGYAYAEVSERFRDTPMPFWKHEAAHNRSRTLLQGGLVILALVASLLSPSVWPAGLLVVFFLLLAIRTATKITWKCSSFSTRFLYGMHSHLQQLPIYIGQRQYWTDRRHGRVRGLIEYKQGEYNEAAR